MLTYPFINPLTGFIIKVFFKSSTEKSAILFKAFFGENLACCIYISPILRTMKTYTFRFYFNFRHHALRNIISGKKANAILVPFFSVTFTKNT